MRILTILLCLAYTLPNLGACISIHLCGDSVTSISLGNSDGDDCDCGSVKMDKDCCENRTLAFQLISAKQDIQSDFLAVFSVYKNLDQPKPIELFSSYNSWIEPILPQQHPPPMDEKTSKQVLLQVFRI